jgi:diguanylate cyclase
MAPALNPRKPHWIVPTYFRVRALAYGYAALFLGLFFWQQGFPAWAWGLMGLQLFVYPFLMYQRALRQPNSQQAELHNLVVDAGLWGAWCAAFGFPLWISYTLFITSAMNNAFSRGLYGLRDAALAYLAGAMVVWLWMAPRWAEPESPWVIGLCVVGVSTYLLSIARIAHIRTGLLRQAREALKRSEEGWRLQANQDALTGLFNRRYFDDTLTREMARAQREGTPISLMVLDVDHFKRINDTHGHETGDEVLRLLGQFIGQSARQGDVACRLGGEEFCVLYTGMTLAKACERAEQLRQRLAEHPIPTASGTLSVTASIGLAQYPTDAGSGPSLMSAADQALYAAKRAGRDRVMLFSSVAQAHRASAD